MLGVEKPEEKELIEHALSHGVSKSSSVAMDITYEMCIIEAIVWNFIKVYKMNRRLYPF